jgi:hypothetical protein
MMKAKNQLDATKYAVLLPQHVSGTNMPIIKSKGKAIPLQALTGPEGSRRLRFPDFMTIST